jgi:hypothetical protein
MLSLFLVGCASQPLAPPEQTPKQTMDMAQPLDLSPEGVDLWTDNDCLWSDWTITSTSMGEAGGIARFTPSQIIVWAPGAPSSSPPLGIAQYHSIYASADGGVYPFPKISLDYSTGLGCGDSATFYQSRTGDCRTLVLTADTDNCTGAREYLDGQVTLHALY